MLKQVLKWVIRIVILILVYLLQIYTINNTTIFRINGDLCLMLVVVVALIDNDISAYITAGVCGAISDLFFSSGGVKYIVIYVLVTVLLIELKKLYKQDSKLAIIIFSAFATVISELLMLVFTFVQNYELVNIFSYILMIIQQVIINVCLAYLVYLLFKICKQEG